MASGKIPITDEHKAQVAEADAARAEAEAKTKAEAEAAQRMQTAAEELAAAEARIVPIDEILGQLDALAEADRKQMELVARARERMKQYAAEIDELQEQAEARGMDVRRGTRTEAKGTVADQIAARETAIRKLFVLPLKQDDPRAEDLLAACGLARAIHRRRREGADFGGLKYFLGSGARQGFYRVYEAEEYTVLKANPEMRDLARRAIHFSKQAYVLQGKKRGVWLLHGEMVEFRNDARASADAEREQEATILNDPLPENLKDLLRASASPPAQLVTFGIVVRTVEREGQETVMIGRRMRDGVMKPAFGVLQITIGADEKDPSKKRFSVTAATGTVQRSLPVKFRDEGRISCPILVKPDPENPKQKRLDVPGWCRDILSYLVALGRDGLQEQRKEWTAERVAHARRDRERQAQRRSDPLLGEDDEKPKRNGKKVANGTADAAPPAIPPSEQNA